MRLKPHAGIGDVLEQWANFAFELDRGAFAVFLERDVDIGVADPHPLKHQLDFLLLLENVDHLLGDALGRLQRGAGHHFDIDRAVRIVDRWLELPGDRGKQHHRDQEREPANAQHPDAVIIEARGHVARAHREAAATARGKLDEFEDQPAKDECEANSEHELGNLEQLRNKEVRRRIAVARHSISDLVRNVEACDRSIDCEQAKTGHTEQDEDRDQQRDSVEETRTRSLDPITAITHFATVKRPGERVHIAVHPRAFTVRSMAFGREEVSRHQRRYHSRDC